MNCVILINGFYKPDSLKYQIDRLTYELELLKCKVRVLDTNRIVTYIDKNHIVRTFGDADFIIYLDKDMHIARMLTAAGYRLFNSARSIELCDDKMLTYIELASKGIAMPTTISSPLMYRDNCDDNNFIDELTQTLGFPMVIKLNHGSLGAQVKLVNNVDELKKVRVEYQKLPHLYQRFISSSYGSDVRVTLVGGKAISAIRRISKDDFRSNVGLGARAEAIELNDNFKSIAEKAASALKLDYCGLDLLSGENGEPVLCEVNSNAYFTASEKASGINIARLYAIHIINSIKR